jgi:glycosyltransferase involved in cell wall biosynthesis
MTDESPSIRNAIGVVAIGRNEGERLRRCLACVVGRVAAVVYVDSGSTDDSVGMAQSMGVEVIELDRETPFTAARARNAGVHRLKEICRSVAFVQVVDGDCEVIDGWLQTASDVMRAERDVAVVCGRRRERHPDDSVYNKLCDMEWNTPVGEAESCGGDAMIRLEAFYAVGGYDPSLIAGEEPEMCFRLRAGGWRIRRIDEDMTWHDARITRFGQWWKRAVRSGHASADGRALHGGTTGRFRVDEMRSIIEWGLLLPLLALGLAWTSMGLSLLLLAGYILLWYRVRRHRLAAGDVSRDASLYAVHCVLSKFPELIGAVKYSWNRALGRRSALIEYKSQRRGRAAAAEAGVAAHGMCLLYVGGTLPSRSETFVYREVFALRDLGVDVHVASVHPPERRLGDDRVEELAEGAIEIYGRGPRALLGDAARESAAHPLRALLVSGRALVDGLCAPDLALARRPKIIWQCLAALALAHRVRKRGIQHVHAHMAHVPTTIAMYCARQLGIGFSFTGHAMDLFRARTLLEAKLRHASFAACISAWHRSFYRQLKEVHEDRLPIVRCGVDVDAFAPSGRPVRGQKLNILSVGRLVPKKGFDVLIEAIAALNGNAQDLKCTIAGDGPERARLAAMIREQQLEDRIELVGARSNEEIRGMMRAADVFVLPCRVDATGDRDGIPVALMEAMACGLCVVSGDLPAIRELIVDGEGGLLVESGSVPSLMRALQGIAHDPARRARLGAAGRQRVVEEFSLGLNVQRLLAAFAGALTVNAPQADCADAQKEAKHGGGRTQVTTSGGEALAHAAGGQGC